MRLTNPTADHVSDFGGQLRIAQARGVRVLVYPDSGLPAQSRPLPATLHRRLPNTHWPRLNGPELIANVVTVPNSSMGKESTQQAGYLLIATSDVPHEPVAELAPSALGPYETDQPRQ